MVCPDHISINGRTSLHVLSSKTLVINIRQAKAEGPMNNDEIEVKLEPLDDAE